MESSSKNHHKNDYQLHDISNFLLRATKYLVPFKSYTASQRLKLVKRMKPLYIEKGTVIINEHEIHDHFYVIEKGKFQEWFDYNEDTNTSTCNTMTLDVQETIRLTNNKKNMLVFGKKKDLGLQKEGNIRLQKGNTKGTIYHRGDSFNHNALLYPVASTSTIISITDGIIYYIDHFTFRSVIKDINEKQVKTMLNFIKNISLFHSLTHLEKLKLCYAIDEVIYQQNDIIYHEGEQSNDLYIVKQGEIILKTVASNNQIAVEEEDIIVSTISSGNYFGEKSFLNPLHSTRLVTASVQSLQGAILYKLENVAVELLLGSIQHIFDQSRIQLKDTVRIAKVSSPGLFPRSPKPKQPHSPFLPSMLSLSLNSNSPSSRTPSKRKSPAIFSLAETSSSLETLDSNNNSFSLPISQANYVATDHHKVKQVARSLDESSPIFLQQHQSYKRTRTYSLDSPLHNHSKLSSSNIFTSLSLPPPPSLKSYASAPSNISLPPNKKPLFQNLQYRGILGRGAFGLVLLVEDVDESEKSESSTEGYFKSYFSAEKPAGGGYLANEKPAGGGGGLPYSYSYSYSTDGELYKPKATTKSSSDNIYAIKCIKKDDIQDGHIDHIKAEKEIMEYIPSFPLCISLISSYHNENFLYFLFKPCLGGDLFNLCKQRMSCTEEFCLFYISQLR